MNSNPLINTKWSGFRLPDFANRKFQSGGPNPSFALAGKRLHLMAGSESQGVLGGNLHCIHQILRQQAACSAEHLLAADAGQQTAHVVDVVQQTGLVQV